MADLTFASYLQGPLGEAIQATDGDGPASPAPAFAPALTLTSSIGDARPPSAGPRCGCLAPATSPGLADGTVVRTEPPAGAVDVEPNYMAAVEIVPPELPWVFTPPGRRRPASPVARARRARAGDSSAGAGAAAADDRGRDRRAP